MNGRSYYQDSYTTEFQAQVIKQLSIGEKPAVILDHTFFYPTSGGQPHDLGVIEDVPVIDVQIWENDEAIIHLLANVIPSGPVSAAIDWPRRFDHMQQHTGQHILSQAFIRVAGAETIGFHLSDASVTIDLDQKTINEKEIEAVEQMTNEVIWQNLPVKIMEVSLEKARSLPLRKIPPVNNGQLRLIDIGGFDLTACGGTHVKQTAEVGLLKILKHERRGSKQRITFCCGGRALADYDLKHQVAGRLSNQLTTGIDQLPSSVSKLQDEFKEARRQLKKQQTQLNQMEAQQLWRDGQQYGDLTLVAHVFEDRDQGEIRALGKEIAAHGQTIALLGISGARSALIFNKSGNTPGSMQEALSAGLQELGSKSGGGSEMVAQGVGPASDPDQLRRALQAAENQIIRKLDLMR